MKKDTNIPTEINEAYLNGFKYHELKEQLEKLGVPKAFKVGEKKNIIIKEALKQLNILKNLKKKGVEDSEIIKQLDQLRAEQIEKESKAKEVVKKAIEKKKEDEVKEVEKKNYDIEVLKRNLQIINSNLALGVQSQRLILLDKREKIMTLIEKGN